MATAECSAIEWSEAKWIFFILFSTFFGALRSGRENKHTVKEEENSSMKLKTPFWFWKETYTGFRNCNKQLIGVQMADKGQMVILYFWTCLCCGRGNMEQHFLSLILSVYHWLTNPAEPTKIYVNLSCLSASYWFCHGESKGLRAVLLHFGYDCIEIVFLKKFSLVSCYGRKLSFCQSALVVLKHCFPFPCLKQRQ